MEEIQQFKCLADLRGVISSWTAFMPDLCLAAAILCR
jgi:hypothetical protein